MLKSQTQRYNHTRIHVYSIACRGDAQHAVPSDISFEFAWILLCTAGGADYYEQLIRSQSRRALVARRSALPAAGPVACGGQWVMTAVDSSSSSSSSSSGVIYVAHICHQEAMVFARNQSLRVLMAGPRTGRRCAPTRSPPAGLGRAVAYGLYMTAVGSSCSSDVVYPAQT